MTENQQVRTAFVATNSINQGASVSNLWKPLIEGKAHIDFAWRTFRWDSEASDKARVHCIIVGFSATNSEKGALLFDEQGRQSVVEHINAYLFDGPDCFVASRSTPLCNVPSIGIGNQPIDGGNYLFSEEDKEAFLKKEPQAGNLFRRWYGADEFLRNKPRYCLWLGDCTPSELGRLTQCKARVEAVRKFRLSSKSEGTRKLADTPTRFHVENMPAGDYIVIPEVSSERRQYVPLGFMGPNVLCSNKLRLMPAATLYHFGVLTSSVHMAWMRAVCGRLEMRYSYSVDIVYNAFVWPEVTEVQRTKIEKTAQAILDARKKYPDSSFADLYDETTMPPELRKAHRENDQAVLKAYGLPPDATEEAIVVHLMGLYTEKVAEVERREAVEAAVRKALGKTEPPEDIEALKSKAVAGDLTLEALVEQLKAWKKARAAEARKAKKAGN